MTIPDHAYSYLDAVIVNKKICNLLLGRQISVEDNFDTVRYLSKNDPSMVDSLFTLMGQYLDLDIYKQTGISYTEFKQMTPLEKNVFLEFMTYKSEVENYDYQVAEKAQQAKQNEPVNEFDIFK